MARDKFARWRSQACDGRAGQVQVEYTSEQLAAGLFSMVNVRGDGAVPLKEMIDFCRNIDLTV